MNESADEVARVFSDHDWISAPVVDDNNVLLGRITIDDVVDVIEEEADEDLKALGGVTSDEELSDTVWTIARARFNWLLVNLATAFLASSVLGLFEGRIAAVSSFGTESAVLLSMIAEIDRLTAGKEAEIMAV